MADSPVGRNNNSNRYAKSRPITLYEQCLTKITNHREAIRTASAVNHTYLHQNLSSLPPRVQADIYHKLGATDNVLDYLVAELSDVDAFVHLLRHGFTRSNLIATIAKLVNHGRPLPCRLVTHYTDRVNHILNTFVDDDDNDANASPQSPAFVDFMPNILSGMYIGSFFSDAGWWQQAIDMLTQSYRLLSHTAFVAAHAIPTTIRQQLLCIQLQCIARRLHAEARYLDYPRVNETFALGGRLVEQLGVERIPRTLRTMWYAAVSVQFFARSDYDNSNRWGVMAVQELHSGTPEKLAIDVLRQTAKACVLKRHFQRARMLLVQAIKIAKATFGVRHYKYADALMDFAFYLLNVDSIERSVAVYKEALKIRVALLGNRSLHVAIAHEDLAYALYVHNYSSGHFHGALSHVDQAIKIMRSLVPTKHLFLASAKRVKALILEEIALEEVMALENVGPEDQRAAQHRLLLESEELHLSALKLSLDVFGEQNVQTAKHYGNLGRLYQSMTKYDDAERMHHLAIRIKTEILGPCDFEVGLSIGHLASLYNYHMDRCRDAEELYLRSIAISLELFGDSYSGLEYDYRGLCNVYNVLDDENKFFQFHAMLEDWRQRRAHRPDPHAPLLDMRDDSSLEEMTRKFFEMCAVPETVDIIASGTVDALLPNVD